MNTVLFRDLMKTVVSMQPIPNCFAYSHCMYLETKCQQWKWQYKHCIFHRILSLKQNCWKCRLLVDVLLSCVSSCTYMGMCLYTGKLHARRAVRFGNPSWCFNDKSISWKCDIPAFLWCTFAFWCVVWFFNFLHVYKLTTFKSF